MWNFNIQCLQALKYIIRYLLVNCGTIILWMVSRIYLCFIFFNGSLVSKGNLTHPLFYIFKRWCSSMCNIMQYIRAHVKYDRATLKQLGVQGHKGCLLLVCLTHCLGLLPCWSDGEPGWSRGWCWRWGGWGGREVLNGDSSAWLAGKGQPVHTGSLVENLLCLMATQRYI